MTRYIDVEKAIKAVEDLHDCYNGFSDTYDKACIIDLLQEVPTEDVAPVKHGKWIVRHRHEHYSSGKPYDEDVCPFCKRTDHNGDGLYCGYCGAKMDGKEQEE